MATEYIPKPLPESLQSMVIFSSPERYDTEQLENAIANQIGESGPVMGLNSLPPDDAGLPPVTEAAISPTFREAGRQLQSGQPIMLDSVGEISRSLMSNPEPAITFFQTLKKEKFKHGNW